MRKLCDPGSLEARRKAAALTRETEEGVGVRTEVLSGAGAMLVDIPADVIRMDSQRTVGW